MTLPEDVLTLMAKIERRRGSETVEVVPCGVHPLHFVKVRASGARSGCPMCEMQIEDIGRSLTPVKPREHTPLIDRNWPRIIGCTCGWRTPPGTADSDTTFVEHATLARIVEGRLP